MKHAYEILISHRRQADLSVATMLGELQRFAETLRTLSPNLDGWLLGGDTKEEAYRYEVFKDGHATTAATAVLENKLKGVQDPRIVSLWNGKERHEGASLRFMGRPDPYPSVVTFVGRPASFSDDWKAIAEVLKVAADIWRPEFITVESDGYSELKTFKDRPGAGWMLYLPLALTAHQVPEAKAIVPVKEQGNGEHVGKLGTVIVSVVDGPFSDKNSEHVRLANEIEIRLADQDLLPC